MPPGIPPRVCDPSHPWRHLIVGSFWVLVSGRAKSLQLQEKDSQEKQQELEAESHKSIQEQCLCPCSATAHPSLLVCKRIMGNIAEWVPGQVPTVPRQASGIRGPWAVVQKQEPKVIIEDSRGDRGPVVTGQELLLGARAHHCSP